MLGNDAVRAYKYLTNLHSLECQILDLSKRLESIEK